MTSLTTDPAQDRRAAGPQITAAYLEARLTGIGHALDVCPTEVPASLAIPTRERLEEVSERLDLGVDHTVVALFGGTGSGKSSLFNALTQLEFADVGARRPTTSRAAACSWGDDARALLDFLGVHPERRIRRESLLDAQEQDELKGLVLLDVPDYDSVTTEHALQVDRLVPLADVLVWVVDPQKYADAALHEGYLRGLGARQEDMLLLVNQIDTLPEGGKERLLADVRELLAADGLSEVKVLPVSATVGTNLDKVRSLLRERVERESNAARTASAELDAIAQSLRGTAASQRVRTSAERDSTAAEALLAASGAQAVEDSIRDSLSHTFSRALARPEAPARAAVASVQTTWLRRTTEGLPAAWLASVESAVATPEALVAQTSEAVGSVALPGQRQPVVELTWWVGTLLVLVGLAWTVARAVSGLVAPFGLVLLVVGALMVSWALVARRRRASQEAETYAQTVRSRIDGVVERGLSRPTQEVLDRHDVLFDAIGM